jgi:hypothetical protein
LAKGEILLKECGFENSPRSTCCEHTSSSRAILSPIDQWVA